MTLGKRLTQKFVERFRAKEKREEIPDDLVRRHYFIAHPSGRKSFAVRARVHGVPKKITLGRCPPLTLASARRKAAYVLQIVDRGEDPIVVFAQEKAQLRRAARNTVEAVVSDFVQRYAKPKNRSWVVTEGQLKRSVVAEWRDRPLGSITRDELVSLLDKIEDERGLYAANRTLAAIRKMWNWAILRGIVDMSPVAPGMMRGGEKRRDRVLSDQELLAIYDAFDSQGYPWGMFGKLLILTGQRRSEVAQIAWSEVDLLKRLWTIPGKKTKARRPHSVPLSDLAIEVLESIPRFKKQPLVFSTRGDVPVSGFTRMKQRVGKIALVEEWRLHDIRRSVATGMRGQGVDRLTVSKILNHADHEITGRYDLYAHDREKRAALERWSLHVERLIAGNHSHVVKLYG